MAGLTRVELHEIDLSEGGGWEAIKRVRRYHASQAFSRNLEKLLLHLTAGGAWKLDPVADEIARGALVTRAGEVVHAGVRAAIDKARATP